jgi:riboflavin biosynthesis pyrimidine reductase
MRDPIFPSLDTLLRNRRGRAVALPARLARLYGELRVPASPPASRSRPWVFSNLVTSLDGVVSLGIPGREGGGDISGHSAPDRMVMGLLRAMADVVVAGSATLQADPRQLWTAAAIYPRLATDYLALRKMLGNGAAPLNVIVSASGRLDLRLPVFASGKVPALIVTTTAGAKRLQRQKAGASTEIRAVSSRRGALTAHSILEAVGQMTRAKRVLVEGGPRLLGNFHAEHLIDEQFLSLAPQLAGRDTNDGRSSLIMGQSFAPEDPRWARLMDVRRAGSLLFLRYLFGSSPSGRRLG